MSLALFDLVKLAISLLFDNVNKLSIVELSVEFSFVFCHLWWWLLVRKSIVDFVLLLVLIVDLICCCEMVSVSMGIVLLF